MKTILTIFFAATAIAALAEPVHALTPSQLAANAAKAKADTLARQKAQAAAKVRADAAAKAKADAVTKAKALAIARRHVQSETMRRTEASQKSAQAQLQIRTANLHHQTKTASGQGLAQPKAQPVGKLQLKQAQPLRSAAHLHPEQSARARAHTTGPSAATSKSSAHAH